MYQALNKIAWIILIIIYRVLKVIWTPFIFIFGLIIPTYSEKPYLVISQCTLFFFLIVSNFLVRIEKYGTILFLISWAIGIGLGAIFMIKGPSLEIEERKITTVSVVRYKLEFFLLSLAGLLVILYLALLGNIRITWIPIFLSLGWVYLLSNIYNIKNINVMPRILYLIAFMWIIGFIVYLFPQYFFYILSLGFHSWWLKTMIITILLYESIDASRESKKLVVLWHIVLCVMILFVGDFNSYLVNKALKEAFEVVVLLFIVQSILLRCLNIIKKRKAF